MDLSKVIPSRLIFEISLEGSRTVCIIEQSRKVTKEVVLSYSNVKWVVQTLEDCSHAEATIEFIKTSKSNNNAFIAQRSSNFHGWYLTFVEYRRGRHSLHHHPRRKGWQRMGEVGNGALCSMF